MRRGKELSAPVFGMLDSLTQSQRRMALVAVAIVFFWPLVVVAVTLPWMLAMGAAIYAIFFGRRQLCHDVKEAAKEHLAVDVDEQTRQVQKRFADSHFAGKETLVYVVRRVQEWVVFVYKTVLLMGMTAVDVIVTFLLNLARTAKNLAAAPSREQTTASLPKKHDN